VDPRVHSALHPEQLASGEARDDAGPAKALFNLRKKRAELVALGVDPTNAEIAKQLNVPESEVAEMDVRLQASEKSLDAPIGDGEGRATAKIDTMPSLVEGPETLMADSELQGLLKEKLAAFRKTLVGKEKELAIFDERLVADDPLTLQELGDRFGISRERVRQLEQRLTGRLREYLRDEMETRSRWRERGEGDSFRREHADRQPRRRDDARRRDIACVPPALWRKTRAARASSCRTSASKASAWTGSTRMRAQTRSRTSSNAWRTKKAWPL